MKNETVMEAFDIVRERWGEEVAVEALFANKNFMTFDDFLGHCVACGGNWGQMLLTGVNEMYPQVYEVIPDYMGVMAFEKIIKLLICLGVEIADDV